jgi:putative transcriptional regulator
MLSRRFTHRLQWNALFSLMLGLFLLLFTNSTASKARPAEQNSSLAGKLLVATTEMGDPRFVETVIYMVKDDDQGALGLVINRPLAKGPVADLLKSFDIEPNDSKGEIVIHYGGPVSQNQGFLLHSDDVLLESSIRIKDGIAMTADPKLLEAISHGKGPRRYLFMLGYAGWAPGQLESEVKADAWYIVTADQAFVFDRDAEKKWNRALDKREIPL